ncbi:serine protease inhibitor 88Ea-like isoform X2 [Contarinia nasturtii]|uniref:serine protease inhibitor 88Ea-like isoform X2 n=1 Tax=Contarinia nasturtii TaxID=265458 RepID=UPI0012D3BC8A|nr:serine protease inhibitor 88Ea-like isoform X2 [Contarinia nasturtii]
MNFLFAIFTHIVNMKKSVISVIVLAAVSKLLLPHLFAYYETKQQQLNVTADKPTAKSYYPELKFAISLLALLQKNEPNESIFYSPHSVYTTLLMAYFGAGGETEIELKQLLLSTETSKADAEYAYQLKKEQQLNRFQNQSVEFTSVEKLYVRTGVRVRDSIKTLLKDSIEQLDFADDLEQSIKLINQFITKTTKNNIKDFLQPNSLSKQTMLVMINAVYFKGQWANVFDKGQTDRRIFYKQDGEEVYVDMMHQYAHFKYGFIENLNTQVLKMPYEDENESLSMFIFLPDASSTAIDVLLDKLSPEILDNVFSGHRSVYRPTYINEEIFVSLPKFSFESRIDLSSWYL